MKRYLSHFLVPAILSASLSGCATEERETRVHTTPLGAGQVLTTTATVRFADLEGGCWTLKAQEGIFRPLVLPTAYQIDGLPVRVALREAPDYADTCMIGPLVQIDSITGILQAGG